MTTTPPRLSGGIPLLGHALEFRNNHAELLERGYQECGLVFSIQLGNQNVAVLLGPELQQEFFLQTDKTLNMSEPYRFLRAMFGEVAFVASHETYVRQRPILYEPFRGAKMGRYVQVMQQEVQKWLDTLDDEGEFELTEAITHVVQQVAGHAMMGEDFMNRVGDEFWELYGVLNAGLDPMLPPHWPLPKFKRRDAARERMIEILRPVIAERRANPDAYDDFLQDFVNKPDAEGNPADDDTIINLLLGLMFAGHETTAGQAAWTIILLLQHPDYLERVQQELTQSFPPGTEVNGRVMREWQHLAWAVRETERLRPSADMLMRVADEDIELGGFHIPAGWLVMVVPGVAHRLSFLFDDPEEFDPLRYAPGRVEDGQHRFSLIGFGGGTHKCAGMSFANNEMMVIAALLFQQFEVELLTLDPKVVLGMGAAKPSETWIRYRRKEATPTGPQASLPASSVV